MKKNPSPDMQTLREAIETSDRRILEELRKRMQIVEDVARVKLDAAIPLRDRLREDQVLARVRSLAVETGLDPHEIERLYRLIMEMSIARQQDHIRSRSVVPLRVAYQGVEGSYSHLTAQKRYRHRTGGVVLEGCDTFREVVDRVIDGRVDLALLPIENTTAGSINDTYDLLGDGGVAITHEVVSHIQHCLLGLPGSAIEDLRSVISHPQGLAQCSAFFHAHPFIEVKPEYDTAGAARKVKDGNDATVGAIASESAARVYGLEILSRDVQSQTGNFTRFVEVAREAAPCSEEVPVKTSLLLELGHESGKLGTLLQVFSDHGVNLTKIESRPVLGRPFQYRFYLDFEGHQASTSIVSALQAVEPMVSTLRILGSYPRDLEGEGLAGPGRKD